jgi:hypothetical protein
MKLSFLELNDFFWLQTMTFYKLTFDVNKERFYTKTQFLKYVGNYHINMGTYNKDRLHILYSLKATLFETHH